MNESMTESLSDLGLHVPFYLTDHSAITSVGV